MIEPTELDIAQMKFEMRQMYKNMGFEACAQLVYEMTVGANILLEVMIEEKFKQ